MLCRRATPPPPPGIKPWRPLGRNDPAAFAATERGRVRGPEIASGDDAQRVGDGRHGQAANRNPESLTCGSRSKY
eukprot:scaffold16051_cov111-Isochrysis_galbana.AAC.2